MSSHRSFIKLTAEVEGIEVVKQISCDNESDRARIKQALGTPGGGGAEEARRDPRNKRRRRTRETREGRRNPSNQSDMELDM